jgi:hypothetical protein
VPLYVLTHRHAAAECRIAFAAWKGSDSPLRGQTTLGSCETGGHTLLWTVEAKDPGAALALLPSYVAVRAEAVEVRETSIP